MYGSTENSQYSIEKWYSIPGNISTLIGSIKDIDGLVNKTKQHTKNASDDMTRTMFSVKMYIYKKEQDGINTKSIPVVQSASQLHKFAVLHNL